jgi:hypothetical protein
MLFLISVRHTGTPKGERWCSCHVHLRVLLYLSLYFNNIIIFVRSKLLHIANDFYQKSELSNQWITEVPFVWCNRAKWFWASELNDFWFRFLHVRYDNELKYIYYWDSRSSQLYWGPPLFFQGVVPDFLSVSKQLLRPSVYFFRCAFIEANFTLYSTAMKPKT